MAGEPPDNAARGGLFESLKGLAATALAILQTRLELLSTELAEEKERLLSLVVLGMAGFFFVALGIVFFALFVAVAFWDSHRLLVLGLFTGLFLIAGAAALFAAITKARAGSGLFAASLAELAKDRKNLQ